MNAGSSAVESFAGGDAAGAVIIARMDGARDAELNVEHGTSVADAALTDATLLAAYVAGDAAAFATLYDRHERPVYRFLLRSLRDAALADDLLQEVWLSVVRHAPQYEPRAKFTTWLFTIARNKLIDHWRTADAAFSLDQAANDADGDAVEPWVERIAAEPEAQPDVQARSNAQARAFMQAVEALPALQREAFVLHLESGMTLGEIAELTQVGTETVKSRVRYALARLRESLREWRN
jgi:RNA polymerase sigma-70 factor (ECF subfamily)